MMRKRSGPMTSVLEPRMLDRRCPSRGATPFCWPRTLLVPASRALAWHRDRATPAPPVAVSHQDLEWAGAALRRVLDMPVCRGSLAQLRSLSNPYAFGALEV